MHEVHPKSLWDTENPLPVANFLEHFFTQPFSKLNHPSLMTGRAEMPAFAGKGQQILVFELPVFYPGKTKMKVPTFQIFINDIHDKRAPATKSSGQNHEDIIW